MDLYIYVSVEIEHAIDQSRSLWKLYSAHIYYMSIMLDTNRPGMILEDKSP